MKLRGCFVRRVRVVLLLAVGARSLVQVSHVRRCPTGVRRYAGEDEAESLRERAASLREEVAKLEAEAALSRAQEEEEDAGFAAAEKEAEKAPPMAPPPRKEEEEEEGSKTLLEKLPFVKDLTRRRPQTSEDLNLAVRLLACVPYVLPLSDALPYGQYVGADFPEVAGIVVLPYAPFLALLKTIPFDLGGIICFVALATLSRNTEYPRFLRFSMQQAILLDIALIFPQILAGIFGNSLKLPPAIAEPAATTIFFAIAGAILYSCQANLRNKTPDGIPIISEAASRSLGPF